MHSEFACEVIVQSDHDHSTLEITFCSAYNLFCLHHRIKKMSNTRNWGSMHSEFMCKFKVLSNHDHSTLEITFCSA